jgi:hypothetical protein
MASLHLQDSLILFLNYGGTVCLFSDAALEVEFPPPPCMPAVRIMQHKIHPA